MPFKPWRVKNFVSEHFPLLYHLAANVSAKSNSPEYWDRRLAQTCDDTGRRWPAKTELIARLTNPKDVIIDVGCCNGSILRDLKARGYAHLHGLEISEYAVRRLGAEGITMHSGALPSIPLGDGMFDAVIASEVLEHIIRRGRFLREIRHVLKPGGQAFVFVPDDCLGPIDELEHVVKFNAQSLRKALVDKFSVQRIKSIRDLNNAGPFLFAHVKSTLPR